MQDIDLGIEKQKRGYSKLIAACNEAASNNFDYIWIDTCCIDKSSSAELSEAINSMFRWYQDAVICYTYLEDVDSEFEDEEQCGAAIAASRWFTRGWTLQEFIAPKEVIFFF